MYAGLWRYSLHTASRIFAPIGEAKIAENKTGAAMALGSFIGYAPAMFCFSLYGYILDLNPGIIGYKIVFGIMACFAFCGAVVSVMLVKRISQRKKEMLAAEAISGRMCLIRPTKTVSTEVSISGYFLLGNHQFNILFT